MIIKKTLNQYRGDPTTHVIYVPGDISDQKIICVVKADKELTSDRLIEKKNTLAGGSDAELVATKVGSKTRIDILFQKADTQDFIQEVYYSDVTAQPVDLSTDPVTIINADIVIEQDVQTDLDDTSITDPTFIYVRLDPAEFELHDMFQVKEVDGSLTIQAITLTDLKAQLEALNEA